MKPVGRHGGAFRETSEHRVRRWLCQTMLGMHSIELTIRRTRNMPVALRA